MPLREVLDPDIASLAALIGDESRARVLQVLGDGSIRPAGELARFAGISAQTASLHLSKLVNAGLLKMQSQGRFRYYSLRDSRVAQLLESFALLAQPPLVLTQNQSRATRKLHFARTCYRHIAGRVGVALAEALCSSGLLLERDGSYEITRAGSDWFAKIGIAEVRLRGRRCIDWSERKPHIAGPLGDALAERLFALRWLVRSREPRVLRLTEAGRRGLRETLSLTLVQPSAI